MTLTRKSLVSVLMLAASIAVAGDAMAAKEKFVRSKPHVNIGTIGHVDRAQEQVLITVGLFRPIDQVDELRTDAPCSGVLDLKLTDATDPAGMPLAELNDVRLGANRAVSAELPIRDGDSGPVNLVVVARDMEVDGMTCIFRGAVEISNTATGLTTRLAAIKPAEFIVLRPEEDGSFLTAPSTE